MVDLVQESSFRCGGLVVYCYGCGHGGHAQHMRYWLSKTNKCAAGCDCRCGIHMRQFWDQVSEAGPFHYFLDDIDDEDSMVLVDHYAF